MAYKTIMLSLNEITALPQLLQTGVSLATRFKAHVKGIYVIPAVQIFGAEAYAFSTTVFDGNNLFFKDREAKVREQFEHAMKSEGLTFDFQSVNSDFPDIASAIMDEARAVDLVVMASMVKKSDDPVEDDLVERVAIGCGRPVLVVPAMGKSNLSFDDVIIGWDGGREAARAVFDALPLLVKSRLCHVCTVNAPADATVPGAVLAESLDRHGIKVETMKLVSAKTNAGEALLRAADEMGSGLIVMGCYGHSRFTEMVFGGTTRHVLSHIERPILLSH